MLHLALLLAASATASSPASLYRVELAGGQSSWAIGKPQSNGALLLFRHYPDGALMSVRTKDVKKIVEGAPPEAGRKLAPGQIIEVGATAGTGSGTPAGSSASGGRALAIPPPGANKDGSALFNSQRAYNPGWDGKLVPGSTLGYPNSPNDYKEGLTLAPPPAPATQTAPGDVPRAPELPQ